MRMLNPPDGLVCFASISGVCVCECECMLRLMGDSDCHDDGREFFYFFLLLVFGVCVCVGMDPITPNELFTE